MSMRMYNNVMKSLDLIGSPVPSLGLIESFLCPASLLFFLFLCNIFSQGRIEKNIFLVNIVSSAHSASLCLFVFFWLFKVLWTSKLQRELVRRCSLINVSWKRIIKFTGKDLHRSLRKRGKIFHNTFSYRTPPGIYLWTQRTTAAILNQTGKICIQKL